MEYQRVVQKRPNHKARKRAKSGLEKPGYGPKGQRPKKKQYRNLKKTSAQNEGWGALSPQGNFGLAWGWGWGWGRNK